MYQVIVAVDENTGVSSSKGYSCKDGDDPMHVRCTRPCEPKFSSSETDCRDTNNADHGFRRYIPGLWVFFVGIDEAATQRFEHNGEQVSNSDAAEGEAAEARGPAALLLKDDGIGDEGEVECAIDDCYVYVPEDASRHESVINHQLRPDIAFSSFSQREYSKSKEMSRLVPRNE